MTSVGAAFKGGQHGGFDRRMGGQTVLDDNRFHVLLLASGNGLQVSTCTHILARI